MKTEMNIAYIDGQNFYLGTAKTEGGFKVDLIKFRRYLKEKYKVGRVYYFLGHLQDENRDMYTRLQESGYIVIFKEQVLESKSNKKGNVDSDLIFHAMKKLLKESENFDKILLVSGDGDFKILVDFLVEENRFCKILFPNKKFTSSLYNTIPITFKDYIINLKAKIEYKKKGNTKKGAS